MTTPKGGAALLDVRAADGAVVIDSKLRATVRKKAKKAPKLSLGVRFADVAGQKTASTLSLRPTR